MYQADPWLRPHLIPDHDGVLALLEQLGLSPVQCAQIAQRAHALNVGAEAVALQWRLIDEETLYRGLARKLGLAFVDEPFWVDRAGLSPHAVEAGLVPMARGPIIAAPQGHALKQFLQTRPDQCRITTPRLLRESLQASFRMDATLTASANLPLVTPNESASRDGHAAGFMAAAWLIMLVSIAFKDTLYSLFVTAPLFLLFAWTIGQRLCALYQAAHRPPFIANPVMLPRALPFYSVLVPLYREDDIIKRLIYALEAFDYPPEKLEILLLVEEDDHITQQALRVVKLAPFMRVIRCPHGAPRTKPRALNIGLRECRGDYVAIYDAEDGPEPDQLRKAAFLFQSLPDHVACLQAELAIENGATNFLTRGFALEYAALFQIIIPGLCHYGWPVALGGTSNHFRRTALLSLQGWDAWNVTEDADLGLRLARHGYQIAHLPSQTWEEAPADFHSWRKQRMRWIKGWLQTSLVHGWAWCKGDVKLSLFGRVAMLHHLWGTPIAALLTPFFSIALFLELGAESHSPLKSIIVLAGLALCGAASVTMMWLYQKAVPSLSAPDRLKAWLGMPLYWLLISLSAWLALIELIRAPFHWNKTPHGLPQSDVLPQSDAASHDEPAKAHGPSALRLRPRGRGAMAAPNLGGAGLGVRRQPAQAATSPSGPRPPHQRHEA